MSAEILEHVRKAIQAKELLQARRMLAEFLVNNPKNEEGWLLLAGILPTEKALESLEYILKINPDSPEARAKLLFLTESSFPETPLIPPVTEEEILKAIESPPVLTVEEETPDSSTIHPDLEEQEISFLQEEGSGPVSPIVQELLNQVEQEAEGSSLSEASLESVMEEEVVIPPSTEEVEIGEPSIQKTQMSVPEEVTEEATGLANVSEVAPDNHEGIDQTGANEDAVIPEGVMEGINELKSPVREAEPHRGKEKPAARPGRRKPFMIIFGLLIFLCLLTTIGMTWVYFYGPCGVQSVIEADQKITEIKTHWDQAFWIANKSSRVILAQPVLEMVDIQRELRKTQVPSCMEPAKSSLDQTMKYTIEAYDKFFHYENEIEVKKRFNTAAAQRKLFEQQMQTVYQCAPLSCP